MGPGWAQKLAHLRNGTNFWVQGLAPGLPLDWSFLKCVVSSMRMCGYSVGAIEVHVRVAAHPLLISLTDPLAKSLKNNCFYTKMVSGS